MCSSSAIRWSIWPRPVSRATTFLHDRGLVPDAPTVALLPGSRRNELERTVPIMAEALPLIRARVPNVQFVVACAPNMADALFAPLVDDDLDANVVLVRDRTDDVLAASDVVITASGTATIQSTLHQKPMVVVYRLSPLTYRLGKPFVHVDTYAMPNLVAGARIVPELIQADFTAERTAAEALKFLTDRELYERTRGRSRVSASSLGSRVPARAPPRPCWKWLTVRCPHSREPND